MAHDDPLAVDFGDPAAFKRLFLGWWTPAQLPAPPPHRDQSSRSMVMGFADDSAAILGPPRVGKTAGVLVPQALLWGGPLISTSTKPDVLRATARTRGERAAPFGGSLFVYAPTLADSHVEGIPTMRWSPLTGCDDPLVAAQRVDVLLRTSQAGRGIENADHWRAGAGRILRPYFLAAARHPQRPADFRVVRAWLAAREFAEPLEVLRSLDVDAADQWAEDLDTVAGTWERERSSFFTSADDALAAMTIPTVLQSCQATDLDARRFLLTRSTLYIVSSSKHQEAVAPLISALIESIVETAYDLHRTGELPAPLLLNLDELPNTAPLPNLQSIVSQGGSQGVPVAWAAQGLSQLRHRYGENEAEAIWSASRAKVVFGGMADGPTLDRISTLLGDRPVTLPSYSVPPGHAGGVQAHSPTDPPWSRADVEYNVTMSQTYRPRMTAGELHTIPRGCALLLYAGTSRWVHAVPVVGSVPGPQPPPRTSAGSMPHGTW